MNVQVALPQRPRRQRKRRGAGQAPPVPSRSAPSYVQALQTVRNRPGRRRRNRRRNRKGGDFAGVRPRVNIDGLRPGKRRHNFDEDEFIGDLLGSTTFGGGTLSGSALQFAANPGVAATFPWLNVIAQNYEKYVFTKLEFYYKHEVSQFATAGTVGKVVMGFDYDAADAPPTDKGTIMDSDPHSDCMPCEDMVLRVDCREAFNNGPKYVRSVALPGNTDIKTYDCGLLNIAAAGTTDNTTKIGELHVRYSGWFEKPILNAHRSAPVNRTVTWLYSSANESMTTGVEKTFAMATTKTNGLGMVNSSGQLVLPAGNYLYDANINFQASTDIGDCTMIIRKDGAVYSSVFVNTGGAADHAEVLDDAGWFASDGTTVITLGGTTDGTGTLTGYASMRIVSV